MSADSGSKIDKFGVELEMVFAFHEDRLLPVLRGRGLTKEHIVKNLLDRDCAFIGLKALPRFGNPQSRPSHRGWALRIESNDSNDWKERGTHPNEEYRAEYTTKYRTYWAEPLEIVRTILQEHQLNVDVELSAHPVDPTYNDWKVSNDCSLVPLSRDQKLVEFHDRISTDQADDWDTTGIEMVTPPMRPDNPISFQEIDRYLKALQGNSESMYGIATSKYAGLHAHIGFSETTPAILLLQIM
jgi:Putative amidoligase enzyme